MTSSRKFGGGGWSLLHFLIRWAGLTGPLIGGVGSMLAYYRQTLSPLTWGLILGGGLAVLAALVVEGVVFLGRMAGRHSAFGLNAVVQILVALVLLAGVNLYSSWHYLRLDWTQKRLFTLPPASATS